MVYPPREHDWASSGTLSLTSFWKSVLGALMPLICDGFLYPLSEGSTLVVRLLRDSNGKALLNEADDKIFVVSRLVIRGIENGAAAFDRHSCIDALKAFLKCYEGKHQDTRGGETTKDGGTLTINPNTDNCS